MSETGPAGSNAEPTEFPVVFRCEGTNLVAVVNAPKNARTGVVLVSGGDQYRVGSHRLFVQLARSLSAFGVAVFRFDHRGIGDNRGNYVGFENTYIDIKSAVDAFCNNVSGLNEIVLCGLCDGASAALMAGHRLDVVNKIILINPWVHTSNLEARARIEGYYISRLRGSEFWKKLVTGKIDILNSVSSLGGYLIHFLKSSLNPEATMMKSPGYVYRMLIGLRRFDGPVLIVLSGNDLVAQEFKELLKVDGRWQAEFERSDVHIVDFGGADHSFTAATQRNELEQTMAAWVQ